MNLGFFRSAKEHIVAIAEIGSGSAAFAVIETKKNGPARILAADRALLAPDVRGDDAAIAGIGELVVQAGKNALAVYARDWQKSKGPIDSIYAIIHAPWTRSQAVRAHADFPEAIHVTDRTISTLAREALSGGKGLDKKKFLEASVMEIQLNGYPTAHPEGKWAHSASLTGLVSECEPRLKEAVVSAIGQLIPHARPTFRSNTRAMLTALRGYISVKEYVAIDITNEATTLTVVYDGVAEGEIVVPEGTSAILQRLSATALPDETLSLLRMLERDHCDTDACDVLKATIGKVEPDLVRVFGEAMGKLAAVRRLPNYAVLSTHADISPWLTRFFSRIDFTQFTQTAQPFAIRPLSGADLSRWVSSERGTVADTGLALAGALVNTEETEV